MSVKRLCLRASLVLFCMGMAFAVATAVNVAADEPTFEIFSLRHCDAKVAAEALRARFAGEEQIRIKADEAKNRLLVFADSDDMKRVREVLSNVERKAEENKKSTRAPLPRLPDLDPENMTDAQMRQAVVTLTKQVRELALRVHRLEDAQKLRVVPLSQEKP